jgi:transposase-like protein
MPWKASSVMEERLRFVARLLDGEAMTDVCRDFGVSRKTGYKIFDRYKAHGSVALSDRSCRPAPAGRTCNWRLASYGGFAREARVSENTKSCCMKMR